MSGSEEDNGSEGESGSEGMSESEEYNDSEGESESEEENESGEEFGVGDRVRCHYIVIKISLKTNGMIALCYMLTMNHVQHTLSVVMMVMKRRTWVGIGW